MWRFPSFYFSRKNVIYKIVWLMKAFLNPLCSRFAIKPSGRLHPFSHLINCSCNVLMTLHSYFISVSEKRHGSSVICFSAPTFTLPLLLQPSARDRGRWWIVFFFFSTAGREGIKTEGHQISNLISSGQSRAVAGRAIYFKKSKKTTKWGLRVKCKLNFAQKGNSCKWRTWWRLSITTKN